MQTFLPYEDFRESARVLDRARLGKQRVECKQILRAMYRGGGWANHPAVRMWRGHAGYLWTYYHDICFEWKRRGYKHTMALDEDLEAKCHGEYVYPPWLGIESFHAMHRRVLYGKMPEHYGAIFSKEDQALLCMPFYLWPVDKEGRYMRWVLVHIEMNRKGPLAPPQVVP